VADRATDELVVRPTLIYSARLAIPLAVGIVVLAVIFAPDAVGLTAFVMVAMLGSWALSVRAKHLFVSNERAGIRYFGRFERSAPRGLVRRVDGDRARLRVMGDRRRPLLILNVAAWTKEQVGTFVDRLSVPASWR